MSQPDRSKFLAGVLTAIGVLVLLALIVAIGGDTIITEPPDEEPPVEEPLDPIDEPVPVDPPLDHIIAWEPIVEPDERSRTMAVGDTVHLRLVGANVTAVTDEGTRITRLATEAEIDSAGFRWIHSGVGQRRNEAPFGREVTFVSTGLYGSRITHLTLTREDGRNYWRLVITNVPADEEPGPDPGPDPEPDPEPEPEPEPGEPVPYEGVSQVAGLERDDPICKRLIQGATAMIVGDTIRISQPGTKAWCIPNAWPAVTFGDSFTARTYPAEPPYQQ